MAAALRAAATQAHGVAAAYGRNPYGAAAAHPTKWRGRTLGLKSLEATPRAVAIPWVAATFWAATHGMAAAGGLAASDSEPNSFRNRGSTPADFGANFGNLAVSGPRFAEFGTELGPILIERGSILVEAKHMLVNAGRVGATQATSGAESIPLGVPALRSFEHGSFQNIIARKRTLEA